MPADGPSVFVFNPTLQPRSETVEVELPTSVANLQSIRHSDGTIAPTAVAHNKLRFRTTELPPLGYAVYALAEGAAEQMRKQPCDEPPTLENEFYRLTFGGDGSITGIFDKRLGRQLIDAAASADDALTEKYLEEMTLSEEDMIAGLKKGTLEGTVYPVYFTDAVREIGVTDA